MQMVHRNPDIVVIKDFLCPEELSYLKDLASKTKFHVSTVVDNNGVHTTDKNRTSNSAYLQKGGEDAVLQCISQKICRLAKLPYANMEPLQITEYTKGKEYRPHYDWFDDDKKGTCGKGQRTKTVFIYIKGLEDQGGEACGGATSFLSLKRPLKIYPVSGTAVMWKNTIKCGVEDTRTLHAVEPPLCEYAHKIGMNAWFRDRPWGA